MAFSLFHPTLMGAPQRMQMGGLADLMRQPMAPDPMQTAATMPMASPRPRMFSLDNFRTNIRDVLSPEIGLQVGGEMMAGKDFGDSLARGFSAMGQGLGLKRAERKAEAERNKTLEYFAKNKPELLEAVQAGMPIGEAWKLAMGGGDGGTDDIKEYTFAVKNGMFNGSFTDWQTKGIREQDPTFGREMDLRGQYDALPEVKDYKVVKSNYERIRQGAQLQTGAGDAAIVFGYMKMLDPTSVVREGEQANARNAAGVPEQVRGLWNQLIGGGQLSDEARQQILAAAEQVYAESSANIEDVNTRYGGIAGNYNLDPSRVTVAPEKYQPLPNGGARGTTSTGIPWSIGP